MSPELNQLRTVLQPYCLEKLVKECLSCIAKEYDAASLQKAGIGWLYVTGTNFQVSGLNLSC